MVSTSIPHEALAVKLYVPADTLIHCVAPCAIVQVPDVGPDREKVSVPDVLFTTLIDPQPD